MTLFLTSSPCIIGAPRAILSPANGFIDHLRSVLPEFPRVLFVCADPDDHMMTCRFASDFTAAFREAGIPFSGYQVLDGSTVDEADYLVFCSDLIVLSGGHVPTQNAFFNDIGLGEMLQRCNGVVMGISAGSMNCADVVYAQPEEPGEGTDPEYEKFLPGLGLTDVNILPHYQQVKDNILDGLRLYEDITFADSVDHLFFALPDGSYYYEDDDSAAFFGEVYLISDGEMQQLSVEGEVLDLTWEEE